MALVSLLCGIVLLWLAPAAAQAQSATTTPQTPPAADTAPAEARATSRFGVGGAYVARRGDCTTCEQDFPFLSDMGLLVDIGRRINPQMDVAAEVYWTPTSSSDDRANVTHFDAIAQYRLWKSHGFFLKGGAGMALVRNWVDVTGGGDSVRSKAFSGGHRRRLGLPRHRTVQRPDLRHPARRGARRPADVRG